MAYTLRQLIDMIRTVSDSQTVLRQLYDVVENINTSTTPPQVIETTDNLREGSINLYFTNDRVRNTLLNGLSTTDYSNVLYSDSILAAIGKLQARNNQQGTSVTYNIGTSGATIPLLSTANTWTLVQTFSGGIVGDVTGTASNASKVANALTINGTAYDGSIARSFTLVTSAQVGAASGVAPLDSSSKIAVTYFPTSGATAGTYKSVTVDTYGRVTAGTNPTTLSGYGITDAIPTSQKGAANGVATLDSTTKIPSAQLPSATESVAGMAQIATAAQALTGADNTTIVTPAKIRNAFNIQNTDTAPIYACRAWLNFNGVPLLGTYTQSGATVTVTMTAHGMSVGQNVNLSFTSGTAVSGSFPIATVVDANTFTITAAAALTTSGNVTRNTFIRASGNILGITDNGTGDWSATFITNMPDANYSIVATSSTVIGSGAPRGINIDDTNMPTVSSFRFQNRYSSKEDSAIVNIAVFR